MKNYDLIILGAGPGGLTAAIYAARYKVKAAVIGKLSGGLVSESSDICNFPTYPRIKGLELAQKMVKHVQDLGVEILNEEALKIEKQNSKFKIKTNKEEYLAKKIIFATGTERRQLGVKREKELIGKGISYCATCDAAFYKDRVVGVVGGGDAALTSALLLAKFAKKVYIIYRRDKFFRGDQMWIEEVKRNKKIESVFSAEITKLIGEKELEAVEINGKKKIKLDGLFIEVGGVPNIELAQEVGVKLDKKEIEVNKEQETNVHGFFAAGDVTNNPLKQIISACGEGAVAADSAYKELMKERGK